MENKLEYLFSLVTSNEVAERMRDTETKKQLVSIHPNFAKMYYCTQHNPHHCYDLYEHTIHSILNIERDELSYEEYRDLRLAMLLHDIGKTETRGVRKVEGQVTYTFDGYEIETFYDHALKSKEIAQVILKDTPLNEFNKQRILFFIEAHDMFMHFKPKEEYERAINNPFRVLINKENVYQALKDILEKYPLLSMNDGLLLINCAKADAKSQSEYVYMPKVVDNKQDFSNLVLVETRANKLKKVELVEECIKEIIKDIS